MLQHDGEFGSRLAPELCIEVGEGLVKDEDVAVLGQGACHRDALAARQGAEANFRH